MSQGKMAQNETDSKNLRRLLTLLLSNKDICTASLHITGGRFSFGDYLRADAVLAGNLRVTELNVIGGDLSPGDHTAYFAAKAERTGDASQKVSAAVQASYRVDGGAIVDCYVESVQPEACEYFGMTWIEAEGRCNICESSGGRWEGGVCEI